MKLTEGFNLLATAPDGIKRLRELILSLAVQGKLVPQDANDEPASELLKQIRAEKDRLIADGKIKKDKPLPAISDDEIQYELPSGWSYSRLGDVLLSLKSGGTPSKQNPAYWDGSIPWASVKDLKFGEPIIGTQDKITQAGLEAGSTLAERGSILICTRMGLGKIGEAMIDVAINQDLKAVQLATGISKQYFINWFKTLAILGSGMTVAGIKQDELLNYLVPTPPATEQARIVAKVEELMALCDALETRGKLEAEQHARLTATLFDALAASESAHQLQENWARLARNFDLILDRPAAVDALEHTLLQLAVRGLLVEQDPNDEPASELLKQIRAEKDRLIAEGKIKKDKPLPAITDEEKPFDLPHGWEWIRFGTVIESLTNGLYKPAQFYADDGFISLRMYNIQNGQIDFADARRVKLTEDELEQYALHEGNILLNRVNSKELVGKAAIIPFFNEPLVFESMNMRIKFPQKYVESSYINLFLCSNFVRQSFDAAAKEAISQASLNQQQIIGLFLPLPPLAEQSRIVARVEALRALCTDLRQRLAASQKIQTHLAETLVENSTND